MPAHYAGEFCRVRQAHHPNLGAGEFGRKIGVLANDGGERMAARQGGGGDLAADLTGSADECDLHVKTPEVGKWINK